MKLKILLIPIIALCLSGSAFAQKASIKTNALYWATTTPNLAFEYGLGKRTTIELAGGYNNWDLGKDKTLAHWIIQPEFRYWFCERFAGTFVGLHLHGGEFNVSGFGPFKTIKNNRTEGYFLGAGVSIGHQWLLNKSWAIEAEIGLGYAYIDYEKYGCAKCAPLKDEGKKHYFGPTRASVSLVYYLW